PPHPPQPLQDKGQRGIFDPPQTPLVADGEIAGNASRTRTVADVADKGAHGGDRARAEVVEALPQDPLVAEAVRQPSDRGPVSRTAPGGSWTRRRPVVREALKTFGVDSGHGAPPGAPRAVEVGKARRRVLDDVAGARIW